MKKSELIPLVTILSPFVGVLLLLLWLPDYANYLIDFSKQYPILSPVIVILWRIIGIVIPPLPGGIVSFALIPVFGWKLSYLYSVIGIMLGACIAFWLARKYREKLVKRVVPLQQLHDWQNKVSRNTEFAAFLAVRFATGPVFDFMSYVAGLSKITFKKFFIVTLITLIPDAFYFYVGDTVYQSDPIAGIILIIIFIIVYYVLQKMRFFDLLKKKKG